MSYDLDCYLMPTGAPLPKSVKGPSWQVAVYDATPIDAEDMPRALLAAIDGRTHLVNLHLEGEITAEADAALQKIMETLLIRFDALIHDLQMDDLVGHDGIVEGATAPDPVSDKPKAKPLVMSFLFNCRPGLRDKVRADFLDTVERVAPKAMPRRFGSYEPMPFTYERDGRDCLLDDWASGEWFYFWRGTAPYQQAYTSMPDPFTRHPSFVEKFACCAINLELSPRILTTKKDKADMMALFAALSTALDVFYAELSEQTIYGGWRGIPTHKPKARCIGAAYAEVWPEFCDGADTVEEAHWLRDTVLAGHKMPAPPKPMLAPENPRGEGRDDPALYAAVFPLELPDPTPWQFEPWDKELVLRVKTLKSARAFYNGLVPLLGGGTLSKDGPFMAFLWDHHMFRLEKAKAPIAPQYVAFKAKSQKMVDAFYEGAQALGATALAPPQLWPERGDWYYACEVTDADGHIVEMRFRG